MTLQRQSSSMPKKIRIRLKAGRCINLWFERVMAGLAVLNLGLVAFNWSYLPWRDFYLTLEIPGFPAFIEWYGAYFKGIEPERFTVAYLDTVDTLQEQVSQTGLQSPQSQTLLEELRSLSVTMIDENPFEVANKSGTLERIKNRMRDEVGEESSKDAFSTFWSTPYLTREGWTESMNVFNQQIRPLMETNYYRGIGENGYPIDRFWILDIGFIAIFGLEFLARTFYLSRHYRGTSWLDAMIWRWYDLFLLLPFWRWLRIIPVSIRLDQSRLFKFEPFSHRLTRIVISSVAVELTEVVILRSIDEVQDLIRQGHINRWLVQGGLRYIDVNGVNEVEAIATQVTSLLVDQVLPQVKPEVDALLSHSITSVLRAAPAYEGLQRLPGLRDLSHQLTERLASEVSENAYAALKAALQDATGFQLTQQLIQKLGTTLQAELQQGPELEKIQTLVIALLDEIKINYIKRLALEDIDRLHEQNGQLYATTRRAGQ